MKEKYKDTDLREALRRKYSDTPQLPADFMEKMQEKMAMQNKSSVPEPTIKKRPWRWIAAAACLLVIIGIGVTMLPKNQEGQTNDIYAQTNSTQDTDKKHIQEEKNINLGQAKEKQETVQQPTVKAKANKPVFPETHVSEKPSPSVKPPQSVEVPDTYSPTKDANLHYASQSLTEDSTYQTPSRMDEFIAKIAEYNHVKEVALDCISDKKDSTIVNKAYVFQDTKELDLFSRLFQAACWYDSKVPGYLLNFSQQQFFFTMKDLRKGKKYLWIAERIDGGRILLFSTHSPIEASVSSACYQKYREQLTHTYGTSQF